jgi:UDP-N-acetylglucosamine acyltransferase
LSPAVVSYVKNVPPFVKGCSGATQLRRREYTVGLRRRGFENETIAHIEDVYRMIYVHNSNMSRAIHAAELELPNTVEKQTILDFIRVSDKGIIRGPQGL